MDRESSSSAEDMDGGEIQVSRLVRELVYTVDGEEQSLMRIVLEMKKINLNVYY